MGVPFPRYGLVWRAHTQPTYLAFPYMGPHSLPLVTGSGEEEGEGVGSTVPPHRPRTAWEGGMSGVGWGWGSGRSSDMCVVRLVERMQVQFVWPSFSESAFFLAVVIRLTGLATLATPRVAHAAVPSRAAALRVLAPAEK